jgi:transcriptional regulator with XRE-family HTH domain
MGELLRRQRLEVLQKGLREMAALLDIAPPHLTDIELGRKKPSEELMLRMARAYRFPEAELRAGWSRPEAVVQEVASQDAVSAAKVPEFLRTARDLSPKQWDELIRQARKLSSKREKS